MSIHHDLEQIKMLAVESTKMDGYNYNVILNNPNDKGQFDLSVGSTYEFVMDSYFNTPRPNAILLHKTKDLLQEKEIEKLIEHFTQPTKGFDIEHIVHVDPALDSNGSQEKLKKGLSKVNLKVDELKYKQGRFGLERISNTNRNDKCNCGSGKKFKKCCGK